MNFSVGMIRKVSLNPDLFLIFFMAKICWRDNGALVRRGFDVSRIFLVEASGLRTLLPR